jgi:hypothetical protein
MEYLYMSQDEGGDASHAGTYNIDLVGWDGNTVVLRCPIYAPCTMKVVWTNLTWSGGNTVTFQSVDKVHLPNGDLDYLCIDFGHDNTPPVTTLGAVVNQGQLCYHTGTFGYVTGDHVHLETGYGKYTQPYTTSGEKSANYKYHITDYTTCKRLHNYDALFINDTSPHTSPSGYNWKTYQGGSPTPPEPKPTPKNYRFKWVLYANKLRNK